MNTGGCRMLDRALLFVDVCVMHSGLGRDSDSKCRENARKS